MSDYTSNISHEKFELIRPDLEAVHKQTRPRQYDLYDIFNAVLYRNENGIKWRNLPKDFPKWELVYYYYNLWRTVDESGESLLDRCLKKINAEDAPTRGA